MNADVLKFVAYYCFGTLEMRFSQNPGIHVMHGRCLPGFQPSGGRGARRSALRTECCPAARWQQEEQNHRDDERRRRGTGLKFGWPEDGTLVSGSSAKAAATTRSAQPWCRAAPPRQARTHITLSHAQARTCTTLARPTPQAMLTRLC